MELGEGELLVELDDLSDEEEAVAAGVTCLALLESPDEEDELSDEPDAAVEAPPLGLLL